MRNLALFVLMVLVAASAGAQTKGVTVIGEVVDLVSYMSTGSKPDTPDGKEVLEASIAKGNPLGILESGTGKLYVVTMKQASTGSNATLKQWIGTRIAAKGDVYKKGGCQVLVLSVIGKSIK